MTAVIDVQGLRKSFGARTLLDGVALSIHQGEKVGLIGRNGSGKTTLLRVLAGLDGSEEGTIALRRGAVVGYLPQDPQLEPGRTVLESAAATSEHASGRGVEAPQHRVEALLTRLGITGWERPVDDLSVGERRRIAVARVLLPEPDLLLLDEPTNHLDPDTILWLEETLFDFRGAALVVTHDRYFLDRVVDRMIEVAGGGLTSYDGGYTEYLEARAERQAREKVEEGKRLRFLERELAWARRSPPARTGKQKARRQRAKDLAAEQRERERGKTKVAQLEMGDAPRLGSRVLELDDVAFSHGSARAPVVAGLSDRLLVGERIGVVGPNGVGKTTFLRMLVGELEPTAGKIERGENTRIGYLAQTRPLDPEVTVERTVSDSDWVSVGGRTMHLRAYLDRFLFPPAVQMQRVRSLSGGERSRLLLAKLLLEDFNLLILDEPTNDLDLETLGILEESLDEFAGCVVVVTHDRYLLDRIATSLWVFEGEGRIRRHHGTWDVYLARRAAEAAASASRSPGRSGASSGVAAPRTGSPERSPSPRGSVAAGDAAPKRLSFNEQRELVTLEPRIAALEEEKDQLSALLGSPEFYQAETARVPEVTARYQVVEAELDGLYRRWVELEERRAGQTNPR